jgi:hypothetical protein
MICIGPEFGPGPLPLNLHQGPSEPCEFKQQTWHGVAMHQFAVDDFLDLS